MLIIIVFRVSMIIESERTMLAMIIDLRQVDDKI